MDLTVIQVISYAACSLLGIEMIAGSSSHRSSTSFDAVVVFTDEADAGYVKALVAALELTLQAAGDVRVVRGDTGIRRAIQSKANSHAKRGRKRPAVDSFMVVAAANVVIRRANFRLRMQPSHCVACERIESESPTLLSTLAAIVRARLRDDPYFVPRDKKEKWSYHKYSHVRQRLSYACHAPVVEDIKQRMLVFPGPSRPLRAVVWLPRPPQEYAWEGPS